MRNKNIEEEMMSKELSFGVVRADGIFYDPDLVS